MKLWTLPLLGSLLVANAPPVSPLSLPTELQAAARCAAAFSIVAADQARAAPGSTDWPAMNIRGREFFVRLGAQIMDRAKLDRQALQVLMEREVKALRAEPEPAAALAALRPTCLSMLDSAIAPTVGRNP